MAFADVPQPRTLAERFALARKTLTSLRLSLPAVVDPPGDASRALFGDLPNPAIVIAPDGKIVAKLPWAEPPLVAAALEAAQRAAKTREPSPDPAARLARAAGAAHRGRHAAARAELEACKTESLSPWLEGLKARVALTLDKTSQPALRRFLASVGPANPDRPFAKAAWLVDVLRDREIRTPEGARSAIAAALEPMLPKLKPEVRTAISKLLRD